MKQSNLDTQQAINVIVVDDDIVTRYLIGSALRENDIHTQECESAEALFEVLEKQRVDVIILDLVLPKVNGLDALTYLRQDSEVGIIMISSRANAEHRLNGLREGADDFLSKPVDTQELIFKVRTLASRVHHQRGQTHHAALEFGNCELSIGDNRLRCLPTQKSSSLTESEQRMLGLLIQNSGQTCSRKMLHQSISRAELTASNKRSVDTLVSRIRTKLKDVASDSQISSIRGQGYRLLVNKEP